MNSTTTGLLFLAAFAAGGIVLIVFGARRVHRVLRSGFRLSKVGPLWVGIAGVLVGVLCVALVVAGTVTSLTGEN